jgi:hypothetical protein
MSSEGACAAGKEMAIAAILYRKPPPRSKTSISRPVLVLFGIGLVASLLIALAPRSIAPPTRVAGPALPYMGLPPARMVRPSTVPAPQIERGYGRFLDARIGKITEIKTGRGPVLQVAFSPDSLYALSSAEDGTISLWDLQTAQETRQYLGHTGPTRRLAAAGKFIISSGTDHTVRLWNFDSAEQLHCFSLDSYSEPVAISPDGTHLLFAANVNDPCVASTQDFKKVHLGQGEGIYAVAWSPSGNMLATGGLGRAVRVYDAAAQHEIAYLPQPNLVFCLAFTADDRKLLVGDGGNRVRIIDLRSCQVLHQFDAVACRSIVVTPDSRYALTLNDEGRFFFWDLETGTQSGRFGVTQNLATAVDMSNDGNLALSGDKEGTIRLWRLPPPATVRQVRPAQIEAPEVPMEQMPVQSVQSIVKDVFQGDYRWLDSYGREKLFQKVRTQSSDPGNEPVVQYAILLEAADIATSTGDADLVMWVSGELARRYPRASSRIRLQVLNRAADGEAMTAYAERQLGEGLLDLADDAAVAGDNATALRAAQRAESILATPYAAGKVKALRDSAAGAR